MVPVQPSSVLARVGRRVCEIREARWTQEQFSDRVGIDVRELQRIESGRTNMTLRTLTEIANALNVDPGDLFAAPASRARRRPGRPRKRE